MEQIGDDYDSVEIDTSLRTKLDPAYKRKRADLYAGVLAMTKSPAVLPEDEDNTDDFPESEDGSLAEDWHHCEQGSVEQPNWAEIPTDALSIIFYKLGAFQVLFSPKLVCRSWCKVASDHSQLFWRCFDMRTIPPSVLYHDDRESLTKSLLHMLSLPTHTPIEEFHVISVTNDFLTHMACRTASLISFSLIRSREVSPEVLVEFLSRCPLLKELSIYLSVFSIKTFGEIGQACPLLKCLWVDGKYDDDDFDIDSDSEYRALKKCKKWEGFYYTGSSDSDSDSDLEPDANNHLSEGDQLAMEIASNMPQLLELQLIGKETLTNKGLHVILDKCVHLESLDIRSCFNVRVNESLRAKLTKIKTLRISRRSLRK